MMGEQEAGLNEQSHDFCLERHVAQDHILRHIDSLLDFSDIKEHLKDYYSHTGRPSVDPELMVRMLIIGYCYGIRSERRLCEEVHYNLAYRWFCRLGLQGDTPNHSTFSKNRLGRFRDSHLFRFVFEASVRQCIQFGLVKGEGFAVDASYLRADASRKRAIEGQVDWDRINNHSRAVREYLQALESTPSLNRAQKRVSLVDPMAQWAAPRRAGDFSYSTNHMMDVENNVILDVEACPSVNSLEVATTKVMTNRIEKNYGIKPDYMLGDTAYGTADNLNYLVAEKNIKPYMPVWDKSNTNNGLYSRKDFTYVPEDDEYECPQGHRLHTTGNVTKEHLLSYNSRNLICRVCPDKPACCPNSENKRIPRSIYESSRDVARSLIQTEEYKNHFRHLRKRVEMPFAQMKVHLNFRRLRLRGLDSVRDECLLIATALNLRKLARIWGSSPPT